MRTPAFCSSRGSRDHDGAGDGRGNSVAPRRRQPARRADRGGKGFRSRRSRQGAGEVRRIRSVEGRDRHRRKSRGVRLRQHGAPAGAGRREAQRPCGAVRTQPAVRAGAARSRGHAGRAAGPYARFLGQARHLDAEGRSVRRLRLGGFSQGREAQGRQLSDAREESAAAHRRAHEPARAAGPLDLWRAHRARRRRYLPDLLHQRAGRPAGEFGATDRATARPTRSRRRLRPDRDERRVSRGVINSQCSFSRRKASARWQNTVLPRPLCRNRRVRCYVRRSSLSP